MSIMIRYAVLALGLAVVSSAAQNPPVVIGKLRNLAVRKTPEKTGTSDLDILKKADLKADDPASLIKYFNSRSLSEEQSQSIKDVISRFGSNEFWVREKASTEVLKFGFAALGPLKAAIATDSDPEVVYRCEDARKRIEKVSQSSVAIAAARQLAKLKSPEALPALLAFLPTADNEYVIEEVRQSLIPLAMKDGKPDSGLITALRDASPIRRTAAAIALAEGAKTPDAIAAVKSMLAVEKDADTIYLAAVSLIVGSRSMDVVPEFIKTLPDLPRGRLWQAEDVLLQLAGDKAPKAKYGKTRETVEKFRDEWMAWWKANGQAVDVSKFEFKPRTDGSLLLVEWNSQGWGNGSITLLGPNLKERVKLTNLAQPMDAVLLPGERIAVAEQNNSRVTIRNFQNEIITTIQENQPIGLQLLPSGKLFVSNRNGCAEYDLNGTKGWKYDRPNNSHDVMGARRLPSGETILFVNSDQKNNCVRIDKDGKDVGKPFPLGQPYYNPAIEGVSKEEFLVTDYNKIQRYSLKDNKVVWTHNVNNVTSLQMLPNGNYLYVIQNSNKIVEITPEKDEVWDYTLSNGMRLARAYRR